MKPESLHNHTKDSDGYLTARELLSEAERAGMGVMAITDHDRVPGPETLQWLKDYTGPVNWTVGTELTCGLPKDLGGAGEGALHLLGLFIDPTHPELVDHFRALEDSRILRMKHFVKQLTALGLTITEDDCLKAADGSILGSPHIVMAINAHPENQAVIARMAEDMRKHGETNPDTKKAYELMVKVGPRQFPYALFMKHSSFYSMPKGDYGDALLNMEDSAQLIRQAGGIAIMAHWFYHKKNFPKEALEQQLKDKHLDGVETAVINKISWEPSEEDSGYLRFLAEKYDACEEVGCDAHSTEDVEHFVEHPFGKTTGGQTAKLLEKYDPNLTWSRLG